MPYRIVEVRHTEFPDGSTTGRAFSALGVRQEDITAAFERYACDTPLTVGRGYQMDLAADLEGYLERELRRDGLRPSRSRSDLTYSPFLNQHADFGLIHLASKQRILFEVEFRPNYERIWSSFRSATTLVG